MCLRPVSILNPNYARKSYASERGSLVEVPRHHVPHDQYIEVPCGKCAECKQSYFNSILQRAIVEARSSYMYFVTLTYDNKHVPRLQLPNGTIVMYSDYTHIQNLFKRFRSSGLLDRDFRYISACEYGDEFARPHFHLLIFVAKKEDDTTVTPFTIEKILKDNLKKYYAINVGTRKHPKYERLFTYAQRITPKGIQTNYFVKFVDPNEHINKDAYSNYTGDSCTTIKTIRYLLGYVNKSSSFDNTIIQMLKDITDVKFRKKLENILKSKVRYSKGFGCGFVDSKKHYLPKISVKGSSSTILYSEMAKNLPKTFAEFVVMYPDKLDDLQKFISLNRYSFHSDMDVRLNSFNVSDIVNHFVVLKYFPYYFNEMYTRYYRAKLLSEPKISYFFNRDYLLYQKSKIYTYHEELSPVLDFIRSGLTEALQNMVPYLAFKTTEGYTSLCKFYRERCSTLSDVETLYFINHFENYDAWKASFISQLDYRKANKFAANSQVRENNDKFIWKNQKKYINLPTPIKEIDLYIHLLSNCKP